MEVAEVESDLDCLEVIGIKVVAQSFQLLLTFVAIVTTLLAASLLVGFTELTRVG